MKFIKKFFYVDVENENERKADSGEEEENPFLVEFPEDELGSDEPSLSAAENVGLDQSDLEFVDDVVAHTEFIAPAEGFEDSEGQIDLDEVLQSGGIDRKTEKANGEMTMEKVAELIHRGVPKNSLPDFIEVSGKSVEEIVHDALRKGAVCDQFEDEYREEHQELLQNLTEEITVVEQETDAGIQQIKEEAEQKIRELEERRQESLEALRDKKQESITKFDQNIKILDDYEADCAEVVKALKQAESTTPPQ